MAPQIVNEWYKALDAKDSKQVQTLLSRDKRLLNEVRAADAEGGVQLYLQGAWTEASGRTALHVAARRGNVELVEQILGMARNVKLVELDMAGNGAHDAAGKDQGAVSSSTDFLSHLLQIKDGDYGLDALAMAVVNCNENIVRLLKRASLESPINPYSISRSGDGGSSSNHSQEGTMGATDNVSRAAEDGKNKASLSDEIARKHISDIIESCIKPSGQEIESLYSKNCDFNFLPKSEFFFHFTFTDWERTQENNDLIQRLQKEIHNSLKVHVCQAEGCPGNRSSGTDLLKYLLFERRDGQGRTPLHVAVDSEKVEEFQTLIAKGDDGFHNILDSGGRTPLYRAAAKGHLKAVKDILTVNVSQKKEHVAKEIKYPARKWGADLDLDKLSCSNGFESHVYGPSNSSPSEVSSIALHVAIIHKHYEIVEELLTVPKGIRFQRSIPCQRRFAWPEMQDETFTSSVKATEKDETFPESVKATHLAVLVGSERIVRRLLKEKTQDKGLDIAGLPASLRLAAALGSLNMVEAILDHVRYDPDMFDDRGTGNTVLHYALGGDYVKFCPHLIDFVGCEHVLSSQRDPQERVARWLADPQVKRKVGEDVERNGKEKAEMDRRDGERRGCINLLLQAGADIWKPNNDKRRARPQPHAPGEFVTWWHELAAKDTEKKLKKISAAANAISVTATLVATASYVGPFQPPLGYDDSMVQVNVLAVRFFVVCDNLSFYTALAAILFSLIPALPLPNEATYRELHKTTTFVAVALVFLFVAIVCVLVAFSASYIAVTPDHGLGHHGLTVGTISCGATASVIALVMFVFQLMRFQISWLSSPEASWRKVYAVKKGVQDATSNLPSNISKSVQDATTNISKSVQDATTNISKSVQDATTNISKGVKNVTTNISKGVTSVQTHAPMHHGQNDEILVNQ